MFGGPNAKPKPRGSVYFPPNPILNPRGSVLNLPNEKLNPRGSMLKSPGSILKPRGSILKPRNSVLTSPDKTVNPRKSIMVATGEKPVLPDPRPGTRSPHIVGLEKEQSPFSILINSMSTPAHREKIRLEKIDTPENDDGSKVSFSSMGDDEPIERSNIQANRSKTPDSKAIPLTLRSGFLESPSKDGSGCLEEQRRVSKSSPILPVIGGAWSKVARLVGPGAKKNQPSMMDTSKAKRKESMFIKKLTRRMTRVETTKIPDPSPVNRIERMATRRDKKIDS